jgi:hypothetical protein
VTVEQLTRLAELAALAAGYFAATDPAYARRFADVALAASKLAADGLVANMAGRLQTPPLELTEIKTHTLGGPEVA